MEFDISLSKPHLRRELEADMKELVRKPHWDAVFIYDRQNSSRKEIAQWFAQRLVCFLFSLNTTRCAHCNLHEVQDSLHQSAG